MDMSTDTCMDMCMHIYIDVCVDMCMYDMCTVTVQPLSQACIEAVCIVLQPRVKAFVLAVKLDDLSAVAVLFDRHTPVAIDITSDMRLDMCVEIYGRHVGRCLLLLLGATSPCASSSAGMFVP